MNIEAPASRRSEHRELHEDLATLTKVAGRTGAAAREVAELLHDHFIKEETYALPPLGALAALARGETTAEMRDLVPLVERFETELPEMLREHQLIMGALQRLGEAGNAEGVDQASAFAEKLIAHAKAEEEVSYPAALLVGRYLKSTLGVARPDETS